MPVNIDTNGLKKGMNSIYDFANKTNAKLEQTGKRLSKSLSSVDDTRIAKLELKFDKAKSKVQETAKEIEELSQRLEGLESGEIKVESADIKKTQSELDKITEKIKSAELETDYLSVKLDEIYKNASGRSESGIAILSEDEQKQVDEIVTKLDKLNPILIKDQEAARLLGEQLNNAMGAAQNAEIERLKQQLEELNIKLQEQGQEANIAGTELKNAMNGVVPAVNKASNGFERLGKKISSIAKRVFIFSVIYKAIKAVYDVLRKAIGSNAELQRDVGKLKAALYTAIQPLIETLVPVVKWFVNVATQLAVSFGKFMATLTGKSYSELVKAAKATKEASDNFENMNSSAKSLKKQLAGFDDLEILSGNGSDTVNNTVDNLESGFDSLIEGAEESFNMTAADFGKTVSDAIIKGLQGINNILEKPDWKKVGKDFANFVYNIDWATILGNIVRFGGLALKGIGELIGEGIKTIWNSATSRSLGDNIRSFIVNFGNAAFGKNVDPDEVNEFWNEVEKIIKDKIKNDKSYTEVTALFDIVSGNMEWAYEQARQNIADRKKEERFKEFKELGKQAVIEKDLDALITLFNEFMYDYWDRPFSEFYGWTLYDFTDWLGFYEFDKELVEMQNKFNSQVANSSSYMAQQVESKLEEILVKYRETTADIEGFIESVKGKVEDANETSVKSAKKVQKDVALEAIEITNTVKSGILNGLNQTNEASSIGKSVGSAFRQSLEASASAIGTGGIIGAIKTGLTAIMEPFKETIEGLEEISEITIEGKKPFAKFRPIFKDIVNAVPLAQGTVIPPNREFLAVLGDQKQGINIESPLSTIVEAFQMALDSRANSTTREEHYYLNETELMSIMYKLVKGGERIAGKSLIAGGSYS